MSTNTKKPVVAITGAAGKIGSALVAALADDYTLVGFDLEGREADCETIPVDLTNPASVELAFRKLGDRHGKRIASVVHLAAYFDFTGEEHPLYEKLNVEGTRNLLTTLREFEVEQFVFSGTMLVHEPCVPGEHIDESTPVAPRWAYPKSKVAAEQAIDETRGKIPCVLLHLAGLYDDRTAVPTLSHQIARIYERNIKSHLYVGDVHAGQSVIHEEDLVDLVRRVVDRRKRLPDTVTVLAGEPEPMSYQAIQDTVGELTHGSDEWRTITVPEPVARVASWIETRGEPVIPDAIDGGEKPFVRPFMIEMASDHYALDISRAQALLDWRPKHELRADLPGIVQALKDDPYGWYEANGITPPDWLEVAEQASVRNPGKLRQRYREWRRAEHRRYLWAPFFNLAAGTWLVTAPPLLGYRSEGLAWSDIASGIAILVLGLISMSRHHGWSRWAIAAVGLWLLFAPLAFWAPTAAAYLNDTLVGALVIGLAVLVPPTPGISPVAAMAGPTIPPGWDFTPSSWTQRLPIIILAFIGLYISRYLTAYQLGHIDGIWDPFFTGGPDPKNGTEEITTSYVSEAWPVPDAGLGALTYMLEILTGVIGSTNRWRTMPWLVILFGIMIVPLGAVSITFIIIQPILLGTWCTLCLVGAAAMLIQIPYSLDELVATGQFLRRRKKAGRLLLRVFFLGDVDEGSTKEPPDDFGRPIGTVLKDTVAGGVNVPWNLALCLAIGVWLMFTRATLGSTGGVADAEHLVGSLVLTVTVCALAEVGRPVRFLNIALGLGLMVAVVAYGSSPGSIVSGIVCGAGLIVLSLRRGPVRCRYGGWNRYIV